MQTFFSSELGQSLATRDYFYLCCLMSSSVKLPAYLWQRHKAVASWRTRWRTFSSAPCGRYYSSKPSLYSSAGTSSDAPSSAKREKLKPEDLDSFGHPRLPLRGYYEEDECNKRRQWVERFTGETFPHLAQWWQQTQQTSAESCSTLQLKGNIENAVGLIKIPVGIAGPLLFHGEDVNGYEVLPMATTEGALVSSVARGATAACRAGGVWTSTQQQQISRAPVFYLRTAREAALLSDWLKSNQMSISRHISQFSQHAKLLRLETQPCGKILTVQFVYATGDAAGQNMTTGVTWHACMWVLEQVKEELPRILMEDFSIEGNSSGDKKISFQHLLKTRGTAAQAEMWLPESILQSVLKVDSECFLKNYHTIMSNGVQVGVVSGNCNVSNIVASVFAATGQDIACTVESSLGILNIMPYPKKQSPPQDDQGSRRHLDATQAAVFEQMDREGGVYVAMKMPGILAGTIGGGTSLPTQKECLEMMGCFGEGKSRRLAEIIVGYALALDISTLAAIASGGFASAHERLGRNRPKAGLTEELLNDSLFSQILGSKGTLQQWERFKVNTGNSILSNITTTDIKNKKVGHFGFVLHFLRSENDMPTQLPVVLKSKPLDSEVYNLLNKLAQGCGLELAALYNNHKSQTGFKNCHEREIQIALLEDPTLKKYMPEVYHVMRDPKKDLYAFTMEMITSDKFRLIATENDISVWSDRDFRTVLKGLADIHAVYWDRGSVLDGLSWLEVMSADRMTSLQPLWTSLLDHAAREFPEMWSHERQAIMAAAIRRIPEIFKVLDSQPQTLIHNDCNPRNICIRREDVTSAEPDERLCMYDWEMATKAVPQRDVAEFLLFTFPPQMDIEQKKAHLRYYKGQLEARTQQCSDWETFIEAFDMAVLEFGMNRLLQYKMAHTFKDYTFIPRVTDAFFKYIEQRQEEGGFQVLK